VIGTGSSRDPACIDRRGRTANGLASNRLMGFIIGPESAAGVERDGGMAMALRSKPCAGALVTTMLATILAVGASLVYAQSDPQKQGPFYDLAGNWSGTGNVTLASGEKERIRCRVGYEVARQGHGVRQDLRCASDSYKFDLGAEVEFTGSSITGRWTERSRHVGGTIVGSARLGFIEVLTESTGFSALLTITTRGDRQTVDISSRGREIAQVSITLRRDGH